MIAMYDTYKTAQGDWKWGHSSPDTPYGWNQTVNWTIYWEECLICKSKFVSSDESTCIRNPDGDGIIAYICPSCLDLYEIVIRKKNKD